MKPKTRKQNNIIKKRLKTNKIIDRILYKPKEHKQKVFRNLRQELKEKRIKLNNTSSPPHVALKFGSFNVQGMLDLETSYAIEVLLKRKNLDVRNNFLFKTLFVFQTQILFGKNYLTHITY